MSKYLNRKDIADLLECSVGFIRKNEKRLGLDKASGVRCDIGRFEARYHRKKALDALLSRGLIEAEK